MLKELLAYPTTRGLDLDSPETTQLRREIIQSKPFLKKIYKEWYEMLIERLGPLAQQRVVEIGSGAGFLAQMAPQVITSELFAVSGIRLITDAQKLPTAAGSLQGIVMINVLHHIPDAAVFFRQATRCVQPGGKVVLIEPWLTPWSRFIYTHLHHEPLDDRIDNWQIDGQGPLSAANSALPWIIFHRDLAVFKERFPEWHVQEIKPIMPFRYLVSGGVSLRNLMPEFSFGLWGLLETVLKPFSHQLSMFAVITLQKGNQ
ncbi:MAG: class I SAM-dependent methyltransferase [Anaerolineales bacterium]|nr:class I SAM-dependent methyltransferase [Anaerolineales bacterium]